MITGAEPSPHNLWMQGILPTASGAILFFLGGWSIWLDYDVATAETLVPDPDA